MRALIVGTGSIGKKHIAVLQNLVPDIRFTLCRRDAREDEYSQSINASVFATLDEAVRSAPDFALIATPSAVHLQSLAFFLEKNIPFYIEKPMVSSAADVGKLKSLIASVEIMPVTQSGYMLRHLESLQKFRQIINSGRLGNVVRATLEVGQWLPDWRPEQNYLQSYSANPEQGGGVIMDLSHELDMARYLFGEFDYVTAMSGQFSDLGIESEDTAAILLGKRNGPIVTVNLDYIARQLRRKYTVIGDRATAEWDLVKRSIVVDTANDSQSVACAQIDFDMTSAFTNAWKNFLQAAGKHGDTRQDLTDALLSTELAINCRDQVPG